MSPTPTIANSEDIFDTDAHCVSLYICSPGSDIKECQAVLRLVSIINNHQKYTRYITENIQLILNDFHHVLMHHDTTRDFDYIYNKLIYCKLTNCFAFHRHYFRRRLFTNNICHKHKMQNSGYDLVTKQILDRIHCFYQHSYDTGFRLRNRPQIDSQTEKVHESKSNNIMYTLDEEISSNKYVTLTDCDETANEPLTYSYGVEFQYDVNETYSASKSSHDYIRFVRNAYSSLKEEICALTKSSDIGLNEFIVEYKKAELHFNSYYCKSFITNYRKSLNEAMDGKLHELDMKHLLALMLYCNYDKLQYEFSKTYRRLSATESNVNIARRHANFYFLGKYIKEAVQHFGTRINDKCDTFYHGVSRQTVFLSASCAYFHGPLSTSTRYSVASCFANQKGLIVELSDTLSIYASPKYFAMHWISCYSNESECLFIACKQPLLFSNIVNVSNGFEYKSIIKSLHILDHIFAGKKLQHVLSANEIEIAYKCLCYQLSDKESRFRCDQDYGLMDSYASKLIHQYFEHTTCLWLDLSVISYANNAIDWIYNLLCDAHYDWINLKVINQLLPNVERIYVRWNVKLNANILTQIWTHLQQRNEITTIRIAVSRINSDIDIKTAITEFQDRFENIGFRLYMRANSDLCVEKLTINNLLLYTV